MRGKTLNSTRKLERIIPTYTMQAIVSNKQPRRTAGRLGGVECTDPDRGREVYMIFNLALRIGFDLRSIGYRSVYRIEWYTCRIYRNRNLNLQWSYSKSSDECLAKLVEAHVHLPNYYEIYSSIGILYITRPDTGIVEIHPMALTTPESSLTTSHNPTQ